MYSRKCLQPSFWKIDLRSLWGPGDEPQWCSPFSDTLELPNNYLHMHHCLLFHQFSYYYQFLFALLICFPGAGRGPNISDDFFKSTFLSFSTIALLSNLVLSKPYFWFHKPQNATDPFPELLLEPVMIFLSIFLWLFV